MPVLPDEEAEIKRLAASVGLDVAPYLRNIGLGYRVSSVLDLKKVDELAKISGDLGRLGGLLKLWLTDDEKLSQFNPVKLRSAIEQALSQILANQEYLRNTIEALIDRERFSR
ncbi:conjugal transfer transcriptional regulator TraJ [Pseudoduganella ginsengisoli]